jgi:hypothetical protein
MQRGCAAGEAGHELPNQLVLTVRSALCKFSILGGPAVVCLWFEAMQVIKPRNRRLNTAWEGISFGLLESQASYRSISHSLRHRQHAYPILPRRTKLAVYHSTQVLLRAQRRCLTAKVDPPVLTLFFCSPVRALLGPHVEKRCLCAAAQNQQNVRGLLWMNSTHHTHSGTHRDFSTHTHTHTLCLWDYRFSSWKTPFLMHSFHKMRQCCIEAGEHIEWWFGWCTHRHSGSTPSYIVCPCQQLCYHCHREIFQQHVSWHPFYPKMIEHSTVLYVERVRVGGRGNRQRTFNIIYI